jgi:hypothetical protein
MKAEQIAQSYSLVDKYGAADITAIEAMHEYARIQIEKDRQRVLTNTLIIDRDVIFESYNNTPIILD